MEQKESKTKVKLLSPKLDVVFQTLFGEVGSERITKKFLEAKLDKKLEEVDFDRKNFILLVKNLWEKFKW